MSVRSHEEHRLLVSTAVSAIHLEFDKIFKVIVEDRSYDSKKENLVFQSVDLHHVRRLFDALFDALTVLQREFSGPESLNKHKKPPKALAAHPCGLIDLELVASVALRVLRISSSTSPKNVRADKKAYEDLIKLHLGDLQALAWKLIDFIFKSFLVGTVGFEVELGNLARDLIKIDLKSGGALGKGSEGALSVFINLQRNSTFTGQVFASELVQSGIFVELSSKASKNFWSLLRSGLASYERQEERISGNSGGKRGRYHQASESDQKREEEAQNRFASDLSIAFKALQQSFSVFSLPLVSLSPSDHVFISENLLGALVSILQTQHNLKFVPEIREGEYLRILIEALSRSISTFQPAYLPPFLPAALRILAIISASENSSGLAARCALMQAELLIHPRRLGPVTFRSSSESIKKVFQVPEQLNEAEIDQITSVHEYESGVNSTSIPMDQSEEKIPSIPINQVEEKIPSIPINEVEEKLSSVPINQVEAVPSMPTSTDIDGKAESYSESGLKNTNEKSKPLIKEVNSDSSSKINALKRIYSEDDDEPLPQIVDCEPDEI